MTAASTALPPLTREDDLYLRSTEDLLHWRPQLARVLDGLQKEGKTDGALSAARGLAQLDAELQRRRDAGEAVERRAYNRRKAEA